jgi:adenosine deaminase
MKTPASFEEIEAMQKVDLHLHLDGAISKEILIAMASKHGIPLNEEQLSHYPNPGPFDAHADWAEFQRFLDCFGLSLAIMQMPETIYDTTMEVIRDLKAQNVAYAELKIAPNYHTKGGHSMEEMIASTLKALKDAEAETGVLTKLVIAIPREISYEGPFKGDLSGNGITAEDIVAVARQFQHEGVVAIDLACAEQDDPEPYVGLFQSTLNTDLMRTVHAGEAGIRRATNVEIAVLQMGANRIGHGLPLGTDPKLDELLERIIKEEIGIARCPLSNVAMSTTDGELDGLGRLFDGGALVSVSSDDPGIFGPTNSIARNLHHVAERLGLGVNGIQELTRLAIESSFASEGERQALLEKCGLV